MKTPTKDTIAQLRNDGEGTCLTLYQPTHRHHPENQQDPIRFRKLTKELFESFGDEKESPEMTKLQRKFDELADNDEFWNHTRDGLAIFASQEEFQVYGLQDDPGTLVVSGSDFHLKPLQRYLQDSQRFQILGLTMGDVVLYEGSKKSLDEVELAPEVPATLKEALGEDTTEGHLTVASYGGTGGRESTPMHHGHGGKKDQVDIDRDRYFRAVDKTIYDHHSRPTQLPLILLALAENQGEFRSLSENKYLVEEGIQGDPKSLDREDIHKEALKIFSAHWDQQVQELVEQYELAQSKEQGLSDLADIGKALVAGRVATLLVEGDRIISGSMHNNGSIKLGSGDGADQNDLLDEFCRLAEEKGGELIVLSKSQMPSDTGAAAICRY